MDFLRFTSGTEVIVLTNGALVANTDNGSLTSVAYDKWVDNGFFGLIFSGFVALGLVFRILKESSSPKSSARTTVTLLLRSIMTKSVTLVAMVTLMAPHMVSGSPEHEEGMFSRVSFLGLARGAKVKILTNGAFEPQSDNWSLASVTNNAWVSVRVLYPALGLDKEVEHLALRVGISLGFLEFNFIRNSDPASLVVLIFHGEVGREVTEGLLEEHLKALVVRSYWSSSNIISKLKLNHSLHY